jgi:hypothetical protein
MTFGSIVLAWLLAHGAFTAPAQAPAHGTPVRVVTPVYGYRPGPNVPRRGR